LTIHSSSIIDPGADLGEGVSVGPFSIIGPHVKIGKGTVIGSHVLIEANTVIGENCNIFQGASIGGEPQIMGFEDVPSSVEIGDGTVIREYATIHRSGYKDGVTRVGKNCMLMAYSHLGHDCEVGDQVIIVNGTGVSGHVIIEDQAFISGLVGIHQFVRIGRNSMIGGLTAVTQDILPFSMLVERPARLLSVNAVGLKRANFKPNIRAAIKKAFKIISQPDLNTSQALEKITSEVEMHEEINYLLNFIKNSTRGVTK
jgi:UDP-N-acetylglucosamine acyltransferase